MPSGLSKSERKTELYQYDNLGGKNDIRLVVLPPGSFYSTVRCDIIHVDLNKAPDYEALSYTWADADGDKSLTGVVSCGPEEKRIPITRNCEAALRHLRLERQTRFVWIDAICINQATVWERNHQVSIMSKICRAASRVVVYLGEATSDSDEFIYFLKNEMDVQLFNIPIEQARSTLRRRWFRRLWVFQEITLARHAIVMCGDKTIPWNSLANFYSDNFNKLHGTTENKGGQGTYKFTRMLLRYGLAGPQPIETLPQLFSATHQGQASDPRNKVFALLGIFERDSHPKMVPDYRLSELEIFENLAVYFVKRFGIVFSTVTPSYGGLTRSLEVSQTWVFDWSRTPPTAIHVGNQSFFQSTEHGDKRLIIRGQRVVNGFAMPVQGSGLSIISPGDIIEVGDGVVKRYGGKEVVKGLALVRVSEHRCVLLISVSNLYEVAFGVGAVRRCRSHDKDSQCRAYCSPMDILFGGNEDFPIH